MRCIWQRGESALFEMSLMHLLAAVIVPSAANGESLMAMFEQKVG
jgi:hypothetical protein